MSFHEPEKYLDNIFYVPPSNPITQDKKIIWGKIKIIGVGGNSAYGEIMVEPEHYKPDVDWDTDFFQDRLHNGRYASKRMSVLSDSYDKTKRKYWVVFWTDIKTHGKLIDVDEIKYNLDFEVKI